MLVSPSILSADFSNLENEIKKLDKAGADFIHLDVMDGAFVPNITFGAPIIKSLRKHTKLPFDAHLMIENPSKHIDDFINAGCDIITIHQEADIHINRTMAYIKSKGAKAGVSINPATSLHTLEEIIPFADLILIMSVNPGFAAQKLIETSYEKVRKLSEMVKKSGRDIIIQVDGGVNETSAKRLKDCGMTSAVAGNFIFAADDYAKPINFLKSI